MLVLTLKPESKTRLQTGAGEEIVLLNKDKRSVSVGIQAPKSVTVLRDGAKKRGEA